LYLVPVRNAFYSCIIKCDPFCSCCYLNMMMMTMTTMTTTTMMMAVLSELKVLCGLLQTPVLHFHRCCRLTCPESYLRSWMHESRTLAHRWSWILNSELLDYKFTLSQEHKIFRTESVYNRKVGFMSYTVN
jgi:hypothetical protein